MQKIDNIEIKNFKSIRHQKIEGCKKINVFIGYPNVGKSNILEALSTFSIDSKSDLFSNYVRIGKPTTLFFNGNVDIPAQVILNKYFRVEIDFKSYGLGAVFQLDRFNESFPAIDSEINDADISSLSDIQDKLFRIGGFDVSNDKLKIGNFEGSSDIRFFDKNMSDKASAVKIEKKTILKYDFNKNIQFVSDNAWRLSHPFGQNIFEIISIKKELNQDVINLFKEYSLNFVYDSESQEYKILKIIENKIFTVPYFMVADTLQRLIFYKAAINSNKNSILLFEEPEAHMFPPYIKKLTTDIILDKTNQFFIATHSPYVLDELILEAGDDLSVYLVDYKDGETIIHYLSSDDLSEIRQYGVDLFFNIESYLKHGQINNT